MTLEPALLSRQVRERSVTYDAPLLHTPVV